MTREEFGTIVLALRAAYQRDSFLADREMAALWYDMLSDLDYRAVHESVKRHILTSKFPPTIAEIRKGTVNEEDFQNGMEAWALVHKAICNGIYHAEEEFEKLPEAAQRAIGSPGVLYELALSDNKTVGIEKARFLKVYEVEVAKAKERAQIPMSNTGMIEQKYDMDALRKQVVENA